MHSDFEAAGGESAQIVLSGSSIMVRQYTTFSSTRQFDDTGVETEPIQQHVLSHSRPIVSYYFPKGVGEYHYGERHPMKPHRLSLTNALVLGYGLDKQIDQIYCPRPATRAELEAYHDSDYIDFLARVTPETQSEMKAAIDKYNCVEDCPVFTDMYTFCRQYAGASLAGARKLTQGTTDIAINWSGGLHHARRGEASGFCYVNDIVMAILELLRYHPRVLYIDIDIHHGDGVELAFWNSNRVMTVSFHKYTGDFFPGTGRLEDNGGGLLGKHFALNVPLQDGIDDESYLTIFRSVIDDTVTAFRPSSIVLQCGADSLGCDRLGAFNLSIAAHGSCVDFVRRYDLPLLVLGGGGYTIHNVSRCWTHETAVLVGRTLPANLPRTTYYEYFAPDYALHPPIVTKVENMNSPAALQRIAVHIKNKLRYLQGAPSVQMQEIPPDLEGWIAAEQRAADERDEEHYGTGGAGERRRDPHRAQNEYYEGDNDIDDNAPRKKAGRAPRSTAASTPVPTPASTPAPARGRGRGGRPRARGGRGRGRGAAISAAAVTASDAGDADTAPATPAESAAPATAPGSGTATPMQVD